MTPHLWLGLSFLCVFILSATNFLLLHLFNKRLDNQRKRLDNQIKAAAEGRDQLEKLMAMGFKNAENMRVLLNKRLNLAKEHRDKLTVSLDSMIGKPPPTGGPGG